MPLSRSLGLGQGRDCWINENEEQSLVLGMERDFMG